MEKDVLHPKESSATPCFKVGDKIRLKGYKWKKDTPLEIIDIFDGHYYYKPPHWAVDMRNYKIRIEDQNEYVKVL